MDDQSARQDGANWQQRPQRQGLRRGGPGLHTSVHMGRQPIGITDGTSSNTRSVSEQSDWCRNSTGSELGRPQRSRAHVPDGRAPMVTAALWNIHDHPLRDQQPDVGERRGRRPVLRPEQAAGLGHSGGVNVARATGQSGSSATRPTSRSCSTSPTGATAGSLGDFLRTARPKAGHPGAARFPPSHALRVLLTIMSWYRSLPLLLRVALVGCGGGTKDSPRGPVKGRVTLNGKPVAGATIVFENKAVGVSLSATTDERREVRITRQPVGLPAASYKITVSFGPIHETRRGDSADRREQEDRLARA